MLDLNESEMTKQCKGKINMDKKLNEDEKLETVDISISVEERDLLLSKTGKSIEESVTIAIDHFIACVEEE